MRDLIRFLFLVFLWLLTLGSSLPRFSGTNQYYLFYKPHKMVDDVFNSAKALDLTVIRTWAFCEGAKHDGFCFQPEPYLYDEETFKQLDYVVYRAKQSGIKLIFALANNWGDFGGVPQYLNWYHLNNHDDFFRDDRVKNTYKAYINHLLNRTNTITGVPYKQEPTILAWELMNEPRSGDLPSLYKWVDEMAHYIKSIDPYHLVTTGSEGSYASDLYETHKSDAIDFVSFHLYPLWWGWSVDKSNEYIKEETRIAHDVLKKPLFLGEFGYEKGKRRDVYRQWYQILKDENVEGVAFWILSGKQTDGSQYPDYDGFTVWYPESTDVIDIIQEYGREVK